jgi:choline dehydrogenase-like flavoprotein
MGVHPEKSVVSPYGQSHDVKNLFIADSSIFVTTASVNPTLTIVALSNRVSDYIIRNRRELA